MLQDLINTIRGWFGEKKSSFSMWLSLDAKTYRRFHNIILPGITGTTQIDHLLVSPYGLFIVETKNLKGWIFGSENQPTWTQSLYGRNYPFQNPIRQTYRQKKILAENLKVDESVIRPVVFFVGDCEFKTQIPRNVIRSGLGRYIKEFRHPILLDSEINRVIAALRKYTSGSTLTTRDHVLSLRERHSSTTFCPKCGSHLIQRIAKRGTNAGSKFLGCERYPQCRFTKNL